MNRGYCPDCDGKIVADVKVRVGYKLTCPHCDADLEVIGLDPFELDWAYDWSWDEDEEEEEEEEEEKSDYLRAA